jgi:ubiquinol-cytochrome c reductase cytochrome c1 subunit
MKKCLPIVLLLGLAPTLAPAAEGPAAPMKPVYTNLDNQASLQRGAKYFVNYCMGCHELKYARFKRTATDLGLSKSTALKYLIFGKNAGFTSMMTNAMPEKKAAKWFGKTPPDLSVIARLKGATWIYNYLQDFYLDPSRPTGTNNLLLPNAAMPDVLWRLQGVQKAQFKTVTDASGDKHKQFTGFKQVTKGKLTQQELDQMDRDIVNFLVYVGEPAKLQRYGIGWAAVIFSLVLIALSYALKRAFWRDVHTEPESSSDAH